MAGYLRFGKRLFDSFMTTFDILSDAVNSFDLLGYNASSQILKTISGNTVNISNDNSSYLLRNISMNQSSTLWNPNYQTNNSFNNTYNSFINNTFIDKLTNFSICGSDDIDVHPVWGYLGISIMFLPGLLFIVLFAFNDRINAYMFKTGDWSKDWMMLVSMMFFPITMLSFLFYSTFTCQGDVHQGYMAIAVAMEAFIESFLQLVLQKYTILMGHKITPTQAASIFASFFILSKASIDLDLEVYEHDLGFCGTVKHYLILLPGYSATISFRTTAFAITIAFLREWCWLPMSLLFVEMAIVCYISFRSVHSGHLAYSTYVPLIITNLGVTNVGMIGANEFIRQEAKEPGKYTKEYIHETNRFVKLSAATTFLHHTIVLWAILGMVIHNPLYFEHWGWEHFVLNNCNGFFLEQIYWLFSGIIGLGFVGLLSNLFLGARGMKIATLEPI